MLTLMLLAGLLIPMQIDPEFQAEQQRLWHRIMIEQLRNPPPPPPVIDEWTWNYNSMLISLKKFHKDLEKGKFDRRQLNRFFKRVEKLKTTGK